MTIDLVLDTSWGDSGKARIVDLISPKYQFVARCGGGDNAGNTVHAEGKILKLHLIPSSVLHPNVKMILGTGMVINPSSFRKEVLSLRELGIKITPDNLFISELAHVVTPGHIARDIASENALGANKIGTTKRGIGPAYTDKTSRVGIRLKDAANLDLDDIDFIMPFVTDTRQILYNANKSGYRILGVGSQGTLLDIQYGTYPFVTSSDTTVYGCLAGLGIGVRNIGKIIGIIKAFQTRIGTGPFPSEIMDQELVMRLRGDGSNSFDEYGSTTGRARRIGWLDLPYLKYAVELNSISELALTKLDILTGMKSFRVMISHDGDYKTFPGWNYLGTSWKEFPKEAKDYIEAIEKYTDTPIYMISIGAERNQMVYK